jgi:hypothetical protein
VDLIAEPIRSTFDDKNIKAWRVSKPRNARNGDVGVARHSFLLRRFIGRSPTGQSQKTLESKPMRPSRAHSWRSLSRIFFVELRSACNTNRLVRYDRRRPCNRSGSGLWSKPREEAGGHRGTGEDG